MRVLLCVGCLARRRRRRLVVVRMEADVGPGATGLTNMDMTCYANSVVQVGRTHTRTARTHGRAATERERERGKKKKRRNARRRDGERG